MRPECSCLCLVAMVMWSRGMPHEQLRYDGHKVLEIIHKTEEDFRRIMELGHKYNLDIWSMPKSANDTMHVHVLPEEVDNFIDELKELDIDINVFIDNIQSLLDEHGSKKQRTGDRTKRARPVAPDQSSSSGMELDVYHTHNSIRDFLLSVASADLPHGVTATVVNIGGTFEGRHVELIKISSATTTSDKKHGIFIDGGIHAREWIAPAAVLYIIDQLAYNPNNDPAVTSLLDKFDFYLLPVVNPDGYEYTDHERLWRKNRNTNSGSSCVGVDLNRNFPFQWDPSKGGSMNPCNDIYSGHRASSEQETQNLVNYLLRHRNTDPSYMAAYLTLHSYGQMWLYPWGYTSALPSDWRNLDWLARVGIHHLRTVHGTRYITGSAENVLYSAAGGSDDFAKGEAGIKYSYTIELRDEGRYGFSLPTSQIIPTSRETWEGIKAFATRMAQIEGWWF